MIMASAIYVAKNLQNKTTQVDAKHASMNFQKMVKGGITNV